MFAKMAKDLGGFFVGDFGKSFAPVADEESFQLRLIVGGERFPGSLFHERF